MESELDNKRGKSKNRSLWILRILLSIYALLYIIIGWDDFLSINAPNSWSVEYSALMILFAIFVIGYVISWKNELAAGVILILWFLGMCYENFFLCTSDWGAGIAMGIPLFILSIFFIVYGIKGKRQKSGVNI
jgi:uncharacterized membrane protein (DUF485 family)